MSNVKGLWFIVRMYLKRLIKECLKSIWRCLTKKRFIQDYKKKKAILLVFLVMVDIHILNGLIDDLNGQKTVYIVERVGVNSPEKTLVPEEVTDTHDSLSGTEGDTLPSAPETIEEKICRAFTDNCEQMIAIARAESKLNPNAYHKNTNGSEDFGIFQINSIHGEDNLFDVDKNIEVAKKIYDTQGLNAWVVYKTGSYLKFLNS